MTKKTLVDWGKEHFSEEFCEEFEVEYVLAVMSTSRRRSE